jgi:hypothetical protein
MPKRLSAKERDVWLGHCAWCHRRLGEESGRIAIKSKFRDQKDYRKNQGRVVSFALAEMERTVPAYVVTRDSPAKKEEGMEIIFQVCSDQCGDELSIAMNKNESVLNS